MFWGARVHDSVLLGARVRVSGYLGCASDINVTHICASVYRDSRVRASVLLPANVYVSDFLGCASIVKVTHMHASGFGGERVRKSVFNECARKP